MQRGHGDKAIGRGQSTKQDQLSFRLQRWSQPSLTYTQNYEQMYILQSLKARSLKIFLSATVKQQLVQLANNPNAAPLNTRLAISKAVMPWSCLMVYKGESFFLGTYSCWLSSVMKCCRTAGTLPYSWTPWIMVYIYILCCALRSSQFPISAFQIRADQTNENGINLAKLPKQHKLSIKLIQSKANILTNNITKITIKMKPTVIKTPDLEQIYNQRYQYEQHKQKLMKIYKERKSQLGYDTNRVSSFQHIREFKSKSFIHKFNEQNSAIAKQNERLVGKLQSVKTSLRNSVSQEKQRNTCSYISPFIKSRLLETEKQNIRISNRMKNMSSSLNQKNFIKDYAKSQKIKNRLMKYTADDDSRVVLKSERYFNENEENQSVMSNWKEKSLKSKDQFSVPRISANTTTYRKSAISHYKKQQILKNKVDTTTSSLAGIKAQNRNRPNTSIEVDPINDNEANFFTTQPNKQKKIGAKKVYM